MAGQLEVDDPPNAVGIDERPVEHDIDQRPIAHRGERIFAARFLVVAGKQPPAPCVAEQSQHCGLDALRGVRQCTCVDALVCQLGSDARSQGRDTACRPGADTFIGDLAKNAMRDRTHVLGDFARPIERRHLIGDSHGRLHS